jgi:serine/threonine protein kinase
MTAPDPAAPDAALDELLGTCLDLLEAGDNAALESFVDRQGTHAEALRRRLALLADSGLLPSPDPAEHPPERLGPFALRGRLGAGAMGVVWRAFQDPPGREVALKVVRPEQLLFPESRVRFRREVELAARLQHPAILPILAVGEDQGLPWFATELVEGQSLAELVRRVRERFGAPERVQLAELPALLLEGSGRPVPSGAWRGPGGERLRDWLHFCLIAGRELARALSHAHSRGVLHRDVKPQNALVGSSGRVWLADFGLASAEGEASLTGSRSAVGSLPYMAPELLAGSPADVRADVYGLGALLYELILLRRPFEGQSSAALVASILAGEPPRPRRLLKGLSADLEAVLLTALAADPARRYSSAEALAEDLDAVLAGRPTSARPRGPFGRLLAAAQRRPAVALSAVLAALLTIGGPLLFGFQERRAASQIRAERDRTVAAEQARARTAEESAVAIALERDRTVAAEQARARTAEEAAAAIAQERDRAVAGYERAREAVERMLARVSDDLAYLPAMESLRQRLLEDAIELLGAIVDEGGAAAGGRAPLELARAHVRAAELQGLLGRSHESVSAYREAQEVARRAFEAAQAQGAEQEPEAVVALMQELECGTRLARALSAGGRYEEAESEAQGTLARLAAELERLPPGSAQDYGGRLRGTLGLAHLRRGDTQTGLAELRAAAREFDADPEGALPPDSQLSDAFELWSDAGLAGLQTEEDKPGPETVLALDRALAISERRFSIDPSPGLARELITARINRAGVSLRRGEFEAARDLYLAADRLAAEQVGLHPAALTLRLEWAGVNNQLGLLAESQDDFEGAVQRFGAAEAALEDLCRLVDDDPTFWHRLALARLNLSSPYRVEQDFARAQELVAAGFEALQRARQLSPDDAQLCETLVTFYSARWLLCRDRGDHAGVIAAAEAMGQEQLPRPFDARLLHRAAYASASAFDMLAAAADLDPDQRQSLADGYARLSCDFTRRSFLAGSDYKDLRKIKNLAPLYDHPEFAALELWFADQKRETPR